MLICKHNLRICNNIASMKFYPIKSIQSLTALAALSVTLGTLVACSTQSGTSAEPTLSSVIGNRFTIGAAVNGLVLQPCLAYQFARKFEVVPLYSFVHLQCVRLHLSQLQQLFVLIEEHAAHYLSEDGLSGAGDTCVVQQVA